MMKTTTENAENLIRLLFALQEAAARLPTDPILASLLARSIIRASMRAGLAPQDLYPHETEISDPKYG